MSHEVLPPTAAQVRTAFGVEAGEFQAFASSGFEADAFTDPLWDRILR